MLVKTNNVLGNVMFSGTRKIKKLVKRILPKPARDWVSERGERRYYKQFFRQHLRPADVFIVGHPKSGNTWLAYMLAVLLCHDRDGRVNLANTGTYLPHIHDDDILIAQYPHLPDPRIFRNEGPRYAELYPKILYLIRDPRAVLVSLYHYYNALFAPLRPLTFHAFLDEYLAHGRMRSYWDPWQIRWNRQVTTWLRRAEHDKRVMIVKYEDMVHDRGAVLARVATFAGIRYETEDLALAVARGSFDAMRKNEELHGVEDFSPRNMEWARRRIGGEPAYRPEVHKVQERARFIRRGATEGWKDEIDPRDLARIEDAFAPAMKLAGYR